MRAEIDSLAPQVDGARQAADVVAGFEDLDVGARLGELIGRGDARRSRADDADSHAVPLLPIAQGVRIGSNVRRKLGIQMRQKQSNVTDLRHGSSAGIIKRQPWTISVSVQKYCAECSPPPRLGRALP